MRHTVWTVLLALLLQLFASSAWALRPGCGSHAHEAEHAKHPQASQSDHAGSPQGPHDSHHCCAVGIGLGETAPTQRLPQAAPLAPVWAWISQSLRPDLRPPI
jgi:Protein of unknown function (DUF2946)